MGVEVGHDEFRRVIEQQMIVLKGLVRDSGGEVAQFFSKVVGIHR